MPGFIGTSKALQSTTKRRFDNANTTETKSQKATETDEGTQWSKVWNEKQALKPIDKRISVFYGHDARHRLNLRDYSFGLDSNCVGGGQLTAMVITKLEDGTLTITWSTWNVLEYDNTGIYLKQ